jgi:GDP-L-fucose synthase
MTFCQKIYVAGHRGMVGSAIVRNLLANSNIDIVTRTHAELDLTNQDAVHAFFQKEKPNQVYLAAARVGGIYANTTYPADFIYDNLMMEVNVIHQAFISGVEKLLFLGSSCIYPKYAPQPIKENALLTGLLEETNEPYEIAKIAGIKMCESYNRQYGNLLNIDFRSIMPTNLYGFGDNYHPENSHVIPALIRRFHEAKEKNLPDVIIWGSGNARREFLNVDDLAEASTFVMNINKLTYAKITKPTQSHINIGYGSDISIKELAQTIGSVVGYKGKIHYDASRPEGPPRKFVDSGIISTLGWRPKINLIDGLKLTYDDFLNYRNA